MLDVRSADLSAVRCESSIYAAAAGALRKESGKQMFAKDTTNDANGARSFPLLLFDSAWLFMVESRSNSSIRRARQQNPLVPRGLLCE